MSTVDSYYNDLLSIVNLKYEAIKTLSNNYDVKAIIEGIIEAGNEFILSEEFLYCFVVRAIDGENFKDDLAKLLIGFATTDQEKLIERLSLMYEDIYYINEIDTYYNNFTQLQDFLDKGQIPLLNKLREMTNIVDKKLEANDFFIIRDILFIILAYCLLNNKEDNYLEYCFPYTDHPEIVMESLLLNGIIEKHISNNTSTVEYLSDYNKLSKYIIPRIDKSNKKLIK